MVLCKFIPILYVPAVFTAEFRKPNPSGTDQRHTVRLGPFSLDTVTYLVIKLLLSLQEAPHKPYQGLLYPPCSYMHTLPCKIKTHRFYKAVALTRHFPQDLRLLNNSRVSSKHDPSLACNISASSHFTSCQPHEGNCKQAFTVTPRSFLKDRNKTARQTAFSTGGKGKQQRPEKYATSRIPTEAAFVHH